MKTELKRIAREYTPHMLGLISGGMAVLCLWIAAALLKVPGAGLVAFAAASGALFWGAGVALAVIIWVEEQDRKDTNRAKAECLRAEARRSANIPSWEALP